MSCKECFSGVIHEGTPAGKVSTVHGLNCYVTEPDGGAQPKGVVVYIPDAFGWELVNNRIQADNYAKKGQFRVLLPDFMDGHAAPVSLMDTLETATDENTGFLSKIAAYGSALTNFVPFLIYNRHSVTDPRVYNFLKAIRAETNLKIGAAGFCWGGFYVTKLCGLAAKTDDGKPLIDCGFTAHPSMLTIPADPEAVELPYSVAHATLDMSLNGEKAAQMKKIISAKANCEWVDYEGAKHGFAVRADPKDEKKQKQCLDAEDQAVRWFTKHLVTGSKL